MRAKVSSDNIRHVYVTKCAKMGEVGGWIAKWVASRACERSGIGAENGAGRKLSERERSGERACEKNDGAGAERGAGTSRNENGAVSGLNLPLKFRSNVIYYCNSVFTNSILPHVKNQLSTGILIPIGLFCFLIPNFDVFV